MVRWAHEILVVPYPPLPLHQGGIFSFKTCGRKKTICVDPIFALHCPFLHLPSKKQSSDHHTKTTLQNTNEKTNERRHQIHTPGLSSQHLLSSLLPHPPPQTYLPNHNPLQPHASANAFPPHPSKPTAYSHLHTSLRALLTPDPLDPLGHTTSTRSPTTHAANAASLLWALFHSLPAPSNSVNWAGFYILDPENRGRLLLGPFQGRVACQVIKVGNGVCGWVAREGKGVAVPDVEGWEGHIACDAETRSEVVVPILVAGVCVGVIDVDCTEVNGFDEVDKEGLEKVAELLAELCDWSGILRSEGKS